MLDGFPPAILAILIVAGPISVLLWAGVLAICGVHRKDIAKWAQRQADKQRLTDLIGSVADLVRSLHGLRVPHGQLDSNARRGGDDDDS